MARINVEDDLFKDPRWFGLISITHSPEEALGKLVLFWFLGQKYWKNGEQLIPTNMVPLALDPVIKAGFGDSRADGVYVKGSKEQFSWLLERREAGRKGGLAKAKQTIAKAKQTIAKAKQNVPSSSSSSSSSISKRKNNAKPSVSLNEYLVSLGEDKLSAWHKAYPNIDLREEIEKMKAWVAANPGRGPRKNYDRFILNWLGRTRPKTQQHWPTGPAKEIYEQNN